MLAVEAVMGTPLILPPKSGFGVGLIVGEGVTVTVGVGEGVTVTVGVGVAVTVAVAVTVGVGERVGVGVTVCANAAGAPHSTLMMSASPRSLRAFMASRW